MQENLESSYAIIEVQEPVPSKFGGYSCHKPFSDLQDQDGLSVERIFTGVALRVRVSDIILHGWKFSNELVSHRVKMLHDVTGALPVASFVILDAMFLAEGYN